MNREYHKWYSPNLQRDMELLIFGHNGRAVLFFPTRMARFYDYENWHVIDSLHDRIYNGELQLFCVDSIDHESFYNRQVHPLVRIARHMQYESYILNEVLPFMRQKNDGDDFETAGCSMGAFHALNLALRHPAVFKKAVGMSGRYDLTTPLEHFEDLFDGYRDQNIYFNMPGLFIPNLSDPAIIAELKRMEIIFVVGEKDVFVENNRIISNALWEKGIWNALHLWDGESHKARYWRHMVQLYL